MPEWVDSAVGALLVVAFCYALYVYMNSKRKKDGKPPLFRGGSRGSTKNQRR